MTQEFVIELANNIFGVGKFPNPNEIIFRDNFNELSLTDGNHELGCGKWITEKKYINTNERCDSCYMILDHPEIEAIQSNHFHRQGWVGNLIVYLKKK